jgi:AAHS family 4-hydroxybenzoate transporter-like MFS transporter
VIVVVDGIGIQSLGFGAPHIARQLGIPIAAFSSIFTASLLGAITGAFGTVALSGRFGRKQMLIASLGLIAVFSYLTTQCTTLPEFLIVRFLEGIGLGAAVPNVMAISCEYSPRRTRGTIVGTLYAGSPMGGMIVGFLSASLIPLYGWESIFTVAAVLPIILAVATYFWVPESLQYLSGRPASDGRFATMSRYLTGGDDTYSYASKSDAPKKAPFKELFAHGRAKITMLAWVPFFMGPMLLVVLAFWMPTLLERAGITAAEAARITALWNMGCTFGTVLGGFLIDKKGPYLVLPITLSCAACAIALLGVAVVSPPLLVVCAIAAGFFLASSASGLLALGGLLYPGSLGVTGVGVAYAVGRVGQLVGPLIVGGLIASGLTEKLIFVGCALPGVVGVIAILFLRKVAGAKPRQAPA